MNGINNSFNVAVCEDAADAAQRGYFYRPPVYKAISIERVVVVKNGTESGKPTVDIVLRDEGGQLYAVLTTHALLGMVVDLGKPPKEMPTPDSVDDLPEYQQRVLKERQELDERIDKLTAFMQAPDFQKVDAMERFLMQVQLQGMTTYQTALDARVRHWDLSAADGLGDPDEYTPD